MKRYGNLAARVTRVAREVQAVEIHEKVKAGELDYKQGERLMVFLDLERLGLASHFYSPTVYVARRREARKLGYSANDSGSLALDVDLDQLLAPYKRAFVGGGAVPGVSQAGGRAVNGDLTARLDCIAQ
jgi:hypothetical protein